jgi:preprotein translocase subunit Sec61beta
MADNKIRIPSGMGGLVRYFDDYKSKIMIKPEHVAFLICLVIIIEFFLHRLG